MIHTRSRGHHRSRPRLELLVFQSAGLSKQPGELADEFRIVDGHEVPALGVTTVRGTNGRIQDAGLRVQRNRIRPQPPHHPGGVQAFIDIHLPTPFRYSGQVLLRMCSTMLSRAKVGSKRSSTSAFMVP